MLCRHCLSLRYKTERQIKRAHKTDPKTMKAPHEHNIWYNKHSLRARQAARTVLKRVRARELTQSEREESEAAESELLCLLLRLSLCCCRLAGSVRVFCFVSVLSM